ncbi:MAG TPA: glycosyltransferase family 2 protein [Gemmataceae bacterium]|nr:glycosyltransferase family 2 protein [Gemmataceae bacterium]
MVDAATDGKELATRQAKARLCDFMESNSIFELPCPKVVQLSILLVLHNRAELTLACLRSMQPRLQEVGAEVVLVDNASRDETSTLLERIRGAKVIRNRDNRGFPRAVNQAAAAAAGELLLLLNNDTEVLGDSLGAAVRFLAANPHVGAVGGRIILLDGTLQEAGCTLWREGHVFQYGRGDNPNAAEYLFQRDVDYCSAAFLMTRRELFARMGGLDTAYSPGYFEDLDYCVRLWRAGWRVVYLPNIALLHYENASSPCRKELLQLYQRNHFYFKQKHADWLGWQCPSSTPRLWARGSHDDRFKVLYLPKQAAAQAPTLRRIVHELHRRNCFVTVYPIGEEESMADSETPELPADVELLPGGSLATLPSLLADRDNYYDCVLASDPEVVAQLKKCEQRIRNTG